MSIPKTILANKRARLCSPTVLLYDQCASLYWYGTSKKIKRGKSTNYINQWSVRIAITSTGIFLVSPLINRNRNTYHFPLFFENESYSIIRIYEIIFFMRNWFPTCEMTAFSVNRVFWNVKISLDSYEWLDVSLYFVLYFPPKPICICTSMIFCFSFHKTKISRNGILFDKKNWPIGFCLTRQLK